MDYLPLLREPQPPAPRSDIDALARKLGAPIPEPYADFLSQSNGGRLHRGYVEIPQPFGDTVVNQLLSTRGESYNIVDDYDMLRGMDRIPVLAIPFADDPAGNMFVLSLEQGTYGNIFFWDHEREPEDGGDDVADFPNMHPLAPDFATFVMSLTDDAA